MKPNDTTTTATLTRGIGETITMRIDDAAMAHVMSILTNLYSDQRLAVVREYSTNARDSMIEAGRGDQPIEITTPTHESPFLVIKDTGLGMSADDMREVYSAYGTSTKRTSDLVNGMLGFGCKSGLTYAAQFQVIGVKNGVKTSAVVNKNDEGVGVIDIMATVPTTDRNGVTVKIPVPVSDFQRIEQKVIQFFMYWDEGTALINGGEPMSARDNSNVVWLDDDTFVQIGVSSTESRIVMGNVAYPVKLPMLPFRTSVAVTAWVNMGDVVFTPSREGLKDNDPRTVATVEALTQYVSKRLPEIIVQRVMEQGTTPWERTKLANQWRDLLPKGFRTQFIPETPEDVQIWHVPQGWDVERRSDRIYSSSVMSHALREETRILVDYPHRNVSGSVKRRLNKLAGDDGNGRSVAGWILLPEGTTGLDWLEGRKHVHKWAEVPEADKADRPAREKREGPYKYTVVRPDGTSYESAALALGGMLCYGTPDKGRWSSTQSNYRTWAQVLGMDYVELTPRQVEKFTRNHPHAVEVSKAYKKAAEDARAKVTDADLAHEYFLTNEGTMFAQYGSKVNEIQDPEFRNLVVKATSPVSPTLAHARKFGHVGYPINHVDVTHVTKRYPLLTWDRYGRNVDIIEALIYVNAKYRSIRGI